MSNERYIVFDEKGIIHNSTDEDAALDEFEATEEFTGNIYFVKVLAVRG